jgi:hypothetical protein
VKGNLKTNVSERENSKVDVNFPDEIIKFEASP